MMTLTARQLYFEAVKIGDELPPLVKPPVDRLQVARYAGASGDWNPLSIDEPHAKNSGFPSALAPGMIAMGFLGELVVDWVRGARMRRFQARFVKIVWPGDVLTARGRVVDRRFEEGGRYAIDIEAWAENQRGELVVRGLVTFQLYYSAEDEARQRAGQPPLVVTREEEEARLAKLSRAQPARPAAPVSRTLAPPRQVGPPPPTRPLPGAAPSQAAGPATTAARPAPPRPGVPAPAPRPASRPAAVAAVPTPVRPAAKQPAPAKSARAAPPAKAVPSRARPPARSAKPSAGKGSSKARPHPAKRPARKEKSARARTGGTAKKPTAKRRR